MLRYKKTKSIKGKEVDIIYYWGFTRPMGPEEWENEYFFAGRGLLLYWNGNLWLQNQAI